MTKPPAWHDGLHPKRMIIIMNETAQESKKDRFYAIELKFKRTFTTPNNVEQANGRIKFIIHLVPSAESFFISILSDLKKNPYT